MISNLEIWKIASRLELDQVQEQIKLAFESKHRQQKVIHLKLAYIHTFKFPLTAEIEDLRKRLDNMINFLIRHH